MYLHADQHCADAVCAVQGGDAITFTWQFVAAGEEKCYHDGVEITATPCVSPMIVAAKAFSSNVTHHNFSVVMTDVCGNSKTANFTYSAEGAKAVSEIDYVDPGKMDETTTFGLTGASSTRSRTGTSAAAPVTTMGSMLRNTGAAFVASVVLMGLLL